VPVRRPFPRLPSPVCRTLPRWSTCQVWPVWMSSVVCHPPRWQFMLMQIRNPRSSTSPLRCGVWPTAATLPEQCGPAAPDPHGAAPGGPRGRLLLIAASRRTCVGPARRQLAGVGDPDGAVTRGLLLGLTAGLGAVFLPGPLGLGTGPSRRTPRTAVMTVAWYALGGLVAAAVYRGLSDRDRPGGRRPELRG
jgi:hypothetical protein